MAIVLQGVAATIIACSGKYGEILNFEVTVDFISFGMTAAVPRTNEVLTGAGEVTRIPQSPR